MADHPLVPLDPDEFRRTAAVLRRDQGVDEAWRFASIELREPPKPEVKAWRPGDPVPRAALAVLWNRADNQAYEAVVDLTGDRVESWTPVPGMTPNFTVDEYHEVDVAMKAHPDVVAALARRGITDLSLLLVDVWTYGQALMPEQWRDRRLGWCDLWLRATPEGNPYAHPVSGLKFIVDMNTLELLEIEDHHDHGLPEVDAEYVPGPWTGEQRSDLMPLHITQPEGVSFTMEGTELTWQNWSMRIGFNYREGPVLYQVAYDDHGTVRDIAYRLSFAEMVVPYRDSSFDHYRRTAYDIGEWGLGFMTTSLELGCDCLGEIRYLDAVLHDTTGEPFTITNAICLHEEDNAVLWKHVDPDHGAEVRRMRRMVVSCHVTVANYEYLVYWRFYQDGNIECEVRATGIMVTTPLAVGSPTPATGTLVDERTYAPFHQHFIVARMDLDVDGEDNTVLEVDSEAAPVSAENPYGLDVVTTGHARPLRGRGGTRLPLGDPALVEGGQPDEDQPAGHQHRLQARPVRLDPRVDGPSHRAVPPRPRDRPQPVGHPAPRRRALARWGVPHAVGDRRGHDPLDRRRRAVGVDRRRALVRLRHPPRHPGGGLADHARRHDRVLAQAVRLLRPEPVHRRRTDPEGGHGRGALLPLIGARLPLA